MLNAKETVHEAYTHRGRIDERLYGAFVEHLGDTVYDGLYAPCAPDTDAFGFRKDVIELVKRLALPLIRYPGGNFTCSYDWEDTVGPKEERPARLELAWQAVEPNIIGPAEFEKWVEAVGSRMMMATNMGTRGIQDGINEVEYFNFPPGTKYADLRCRHGHAEPYHIREWCVGNETDGPWQIARRRPKEYAWLAAETCKALKRMDESLELVVVGSSMPGIETFGEWDRKVLKAAYEYCDYISLHNYLGCEVPEERTAEYLAGAIAVREQIETITAVCDAVKGMKKTAKTMYLSFDEYNVIPNGTTEKIADAAPGEERRFTMQNALLYGSMMITLMKHSDRVRIACQSILINGGGGLVICHKDKPAWANIHYYIMEQASKWGRGRLVDAVYELPQYGTQKYGMTDGIDAVTIREDDELRFFTVNRMKEEVCLDVTAEGFGKMEPVEHVRLCAGRLSDANTQENPLCVKPETVDDILIQGTQIRLHMAAYSWNVYRILTDKDA